ncbi:MAG: GyrI-like domain-containing protein [Myxococcota bacterium]
MKESSLVLSRDIVVIGIEQRVLPETAAQAIPALWRRFMNEPIVAGIKRVEADSNTYAVYCDYEADFNRAYTLVLGVASTGDAVVPINRRRVRIPAGEYRVFRASGAPERALWETWSYINQAWPRRAERRYLVDFERYAVDAFNGDGLSADVAVGLD